MNSAMIIMAAEISRLKVENIELKDKLERAYLLIDELNDTLLDNERLRAMLMSEEEYE